MNMTRRTIIPFCVVVSALACGDSGNSSTNQSTGGEPVAKVGDRDVTDAQFKAYLKLKNISADDATRSGRALDQYLEREALAEAIESGGGLDKALIDAELNETRKEVVISRYFQKFLATKSDVSAIQGYYAAHAGDYEERKVHVAHILFRTNKKMSDEERGAKLTAARDAHSKVTSGADFAVVAAEVSEDKVSGKKGGDLGWLKEGSIDPKFSKVAFELDKDAISDPFETNFGFHVVRGLEPAQTIKKPLAAVEGDIRHQLRAEAKKAELERLTAKVPVERLGSKAAAEEVAEK